MPVVLRSDVEKDTVIVTGQSERVPTRTEPGVAEREDLYWLYATLWEAAAGLYDHAAAKAWQSRAMQVPVPEWMFRSTWDQVQSLKDLV